MRFWLAGDRGFRADFRAFADVQGGLEALIVPGERAATRDPVVAQRLAQARLDALIGRREARRDGRLIDAAPTFAAYLEHHLAAKARRPRIKPSTIARDRHALERVVKTLGAGLTVADLTVPRVREHVHARRRAGVAEQTILNELHAVSNLWRYAKAEKLVAGDNPVPSVKQLEQIEPGRAEAVWLEAGEAARLLAACQALDETPGQGRCPFFAAVVGTYMLTGGRKREVLGLEVRDVELDDAGGWLHVRPNRWRGLKSRHATRAVPIWSQLRALLTSHMERHAPRGLLFPVRGKHGERPYASLDNALATAVRAAQIDKPVTWHTLRHTYCAHRLYTLEGGAPVSVWQVVAELGHRDTGMVERVYGHVLRDRDRRGMRGAEVCYEVARVLRFPAANTGG